MNVKYFSFLFLLSFASCSVIIPDYLSPQSFSVSSVPSFITSYLPAIKKGNDHRVGFGFAFGNHADFQVLFELGPQTNTMNLKLMKNDKGHNEIQPRPGNMPQNVLEDLKRLYGQKREEAIKMTVESKRTDQEIKKITDDLSNVDLDYIGV